MNRPVSERMRSDSGGMRDDSSLGGGSSPPVSCPNQAFLLALAAWAAPRRSAARPEAKGLAFREDPESHLNPELRQELRPLLEQMRDSEEEIIGAAEALGRLRRAHQAESRADLDRIHPSWWLRALREEPPSVRAVVALHGPPRVRKALTARSGLSPDPASMSRPIPPEVLGWVLALWPERLIGDLPERDDDPLAIAAITRLEAGSAYRVIRTAGLVKLALAGSAREEFPEIRTSPGDGARISSFRRFFTPIEPNVREWARRDLLVTRPRGGVPGLSTTRRLASTGLSTIARLLAVSEPYRVRWALQHLPYPVAKRIRNQMPRPAPPSKAVVKLEHLVLATAWRRLEEEGRIVTRSHAPAATSGSAPC